MNRVLCVATMSVCVLALPSTAGADDGGFWDMLFHWGTKFSGYGTEFHVACWSDSHHKVENCEELFRGFRNAFHPEKNVHYFTEYANNEAREVPFARIHHEINLRVSYMHSYGLRIPNEALAPDDPKHDDSRKVQAFKPLGLYNYRYQRVDAGGGGGVILLFGEDVHPVWRGDVRAYVSYGIGREWYVRTDLSYLTNTITGADFGHPTANFTIHPGWNISGTVGFDFRRVGEVRRASSR
jgi:hypothetical protein